MSLACGQQIVSYITSGRRDDNGASVRNAAPPDLTTNSKMDPMNILNAESYNDGSRTATAQSRKRRASRYEEHQSLSTVFGLELSNGKASAGQIQSSDDGGEQVPARRRKKAKPSEDDGEEDAAKKSRGRPRLDTKDETAADRRRTQIRLAQRAYRNRKETTIAALEKQVQDLRGNNEQMSNIFMTLYDFAVKKGLVEREPEFAQHLRSTTQQFLSLANAAGDDIVKEEAESDLPARESILSQQTYPVHRNHSGQTPKVSGQPDPWGYQVTQDTDYSSGSVDFSQAGLQLLPNDRLLVARATPENASFNLDSFFPDNSNVQQWRVELPNTTPEVFHQYTPINEPLGLPRTFSTSESTFARRLTRTSAERALILLLNEQRLPRRFDEVFGFCLKFSTRAQIRARFEQVISKSTKESLYAWNEPFVHLGGAGTYYPNYDPSTTGELMPKFRTGMSMGPFAENVSGVQSTALINCFRMNLPGFTGEFFDANDVESYLTNKGLDLAGNPEVIAVDLDKLDLGDSDGSLSSATGPATPPNGGDSLNPSISYMDTLIELPVASTEPFSKGFGAGVSMDSFQAEFVDWNEVPMEDLPVSPPKAVEQADSYELFPDAPRVVRLNLAVLIDELVTEAKCLGRTPGFKAASVDSAVRRAILKSV